MTSRLSVCWGLSAALLALGGKMVTATLEDDVTDSQGAVLTGAQMLVTNDDRKAVERIVVTDRRGTFVATLLPIGPTR